MKSFFLKKYDFMILSVLRFIVMILKIKKYNKFCDFKYVVKHFVNANWIQFLEQKIYGKDCLESINF